MPTGNLQAKCLLFAIRKRGRILLGEVRKRGMGAERTVLLSKTIVSVVLSVGGE